MLNTRPVASRFGFDDDAPPPLARACDHPGCAGAGEFRAPRSRDTLNEYYWFCLDHVRSYNASWNYYAGMSETEIEAELRKDMVGHRPSWKFGHRVAWRFADGVKDFGLFDFEEEAVSVKRRARPQTPQEKALEIFDLALPLNVATLKRRYKELVKLHHPDANGGDKAAEERLKIINQAYATLKASYFPS
ncbi:MAG TPA: J domain-containing protein [Stellaceae bacterium]|nr:J domain-containing protein [Stellaceae bacterium]